MGIGLEPISMQYAGGILLPPAQKLAATLFYSSPVTGRKNPVTGRKKSPATGRKEHPVAGPERNPVTEWATCPVIVF